MVYLGGGGSGLHEERWPVGATTQCRGNDDEGLARGVAAAGRVLMKSLAETRGMARRGRDCRDTVERGWARRTVSSGGEAR